MIYKEITTPDGRYLKYHVIVDKQVDLSTFTITLKLTSCKDKNPPSWTEDYYVELFNTEYSFEMMQDEVLELRATEAVWKLIGSEPDLSLADLKEKKRRDIDNWRGQERYSTVEVLGYTWQADSNSQALISDAVNFAISGINDPPPVWRTMDNQDVAVSLDDIKLIAGAMAQKTRLAFYKSFQLKALVEAASSASEVNAITWETPT